MRSIRSREEAREVTAVRLTEKRRFAKSGDLFRLSPYPDVFLWGRLIKKARFFGADFEANLVYIYDAVSRERPQPELLVPSNLIIGPSVVNNLGWVRGYWEIMANQPLLPADTRGEHLFVKYGWTGSSTDYQLVHEDGRLAVDRIADRASLGGSGYSNFNYVDWLIRGILEDRNVIPR